MNNHTAVAALVKQNNKVLLVRNKGDTKRYPSFWTFPSGTLEVGETAYEAIYREVKEEAGADVISIDGLAFAGHCISDAEQGLTNFLVFLVSISEKSNLTPMDPDEEIVEAKFFTFEEALTHLEKIPFDMMREPPIYYLKNNTAGKTPFWVYRKNAQGLYDVSMY